MVNHTHQNSSSIEPTLPSKKGQVGNNQPKTDGGRHT